VLREPEAQQLATSNRLDDAPVAADQWLAGCSSTGIIAIMA